MKRRRKNKLQLRNLADQQAVRRAESYIELQIKNLRGQELRDALEIGKISAAIGVSPSVLARQFIRVRKMTLKRYIFERLMVWGAQMLILTEKPIAEIEAICGQPSFKWVFTHTFGIRPADFRRLWRL